jgi:hypothetical protein
MKLLSLYIIILLASVTSVAYAIKLPSYAFYGANELYVENEDFIEYSAGTQIGNINMLLETTNDDWGEVCVDQANGDNDACLECCAESLDNVPEEDDNTFILFNTCRSMCGDSESLAPVGSTLWLLLFVFAYAGVKVYSGKKVKEAI